MKRVAIALIACALAIGEVVNVAPVAARTNNSAQCTLAANLTHVRHRVEGAIEQLQADSGYYNGHRLAAIDALADARLELFAAEKYAVTTYDDNPACFPASESSSGGDLPWKLPVSAGSGDSWGVRRWTDELIAQLDQDNRSYGGHRQSAIANLQVARGELLACEQLSAHT